MSDHSQILVSHSQMDTFAGNPGSGWNFAWGFPQIHEYLLPEVRPIDLVLDLGTGYGRSAFPFAMMGAKVHAVDTKQELLVGAVDLFAEAGLEFASVNIMSAEVFLADDHRLYDFVIMSDLLIHLPKSQGLKLIEDVFDHCSGYLFISVPCVLGWTFAYHQENNYGNPEPMTYLDVCNCSGEEQVEPVAYYVPGEIESLIVSNGGNILFAGKVEIHNGNYSWVIVAEI